MGKRPQVSPNIVLRLGAICRALPETHQENAWVGVRWRVRQATFAHVLLIDRGWPPAYAKAAKMEGPATLLTFRSAIAALDPAHYAEAPFFRPVWWPDIVGMTIDDRTDWNAVSDLLAGSYRLLAPRKLAGLLTAPDPADRPTS